MQQISPYSLLALLALAFPLSVSGAQAQLRSPVSIITGTVRGGDGSPMPLADVTLKTAAFKLVTMTHADSSGRFALAYAGAGSVFVGFGGVGHEEYTEEIYLPEPQTVVLDARIAASVYIDSITSVKAIGDFNDFKWSTARALTNDSNGTRMLDVTASADTIGYQLIGVGDQGRIPGTDAVRYAFRGPGDYAGVVPTRNGKASIVLTPARLPRVTGATQIEIQDSTSRTARVARVLESMAAHTRAMLEGYGIPRARR